MGNKAGLASTLDGAGGSDILFGRDAADAPAGGAGYDRIDGHGGAARVVVAAGAKVRFAPGSGITAFGQLATASGNTQAEWARGNALLLFGVTGMTASDFVFG